MNYSSLYDLLMHHEINFDRIFEHLQDAHDVKDKEYRGYFKHFREIVDSKPEPHKDAMTIKLVTVTSDWDGESHTYTDVYGVDAKGESWSLSFVPWAEWLLLPVVCEVEGLDANAIAAEILWEMTWYGDEVATQKIKSDITKVMEDVALGRADLIKVEPSDDWKH